MELIRETARIVAEYVRNNPVAVNDLPSLITNTHQALAKAGVEPETTGPAPTPAVPIKKSVTASHLVCLDCGKPFKTLKRHLTVDHNTMPAEYRARWGLAADYPMVAPDYAEQRSAMAHRIGLGTKRTKPTTDASEAGSVADPPAEAETPGYRYPASRWSKPAED